MAKKDKKKKKNKGSKVEQFNVMLNKHKDEIEMYKDEKGWAKKAILNTAHAGKFSSDRTIQQYVDDIWHLDKVVLK